MTNAFYYGDNLAVLRERVPDESVDLVYLDPPFNSNTSYNVLFREQSDEESPAQIRAFTDTREWTQESERTYTQEIIENPGTPPNIFLDEDFAEWYNRGSLASACTYVGIDGSYHIMGAEITFNDVHTWIHDCSTSYDVEFSGLHEFGHFAGGLNDDTSDSAAIMYQTGSCATFLDDHDIDSMDEVYNSR